MTQRPFSRPGAIDLSGLARTPGPGAGAGPAGAGAGSASGAGAAAAGGASYWLDVTQENFQATVEASVTAPVLLVFYSPSRMPESAQMARDLATVAEEFEGRFLAGLVDIDTQAAIAQAVQLQQVPFVFAVIDARPQPLLQDLLGLDDLRATINQVMQQLTAQGITGRHQPRHAGPADGADDDEQLDPRYAPAQDALAAGDVDRAVAEYEKLLAANPADAEAAAGLAMAKVLQRTASVDPAAARAAADGAPDDVAAQTLAADLDLLDGDLDAAFSRLVELVRRSAGDDRNAAREHLLGLFAAVGNDDPRVLKGRQALASALF
ncbi:tetratricopeptide repeat protein [Nocardioides flavescens]|uniref:Tetratricopeptide repeat protein n=1 Tax=Nocardioides flavescens TaxID=2691959 RepID=A0A6L7F1E3_9ACTN|nr:tetratricopeptide repeat protein [Nocardioides flavescens]MXG90989.1 tetratricopeptide repeat protein [Nocardioides flavescens]